MKTVILISVLGGAVLGAGATYLLMRDASPALKAVQAPGQAQGEHTPEGDQPMEDNVDPFASREINASGFPKMDMTNPTQRDLCISNWYFDMGTVVDNLEFHTGRKFLTVAKLHAGPVEILEEQIVFMKEFLAETERLSQRTSADENSKEE